MPNPRALFLLLLPLLCPQGLAAAELTSGHSGVVLSGRAIEPGEARNYRETATQLAHPLAESAEVRVLLSRTDAGKADDSPHSGLAAEVTWRPGGNHARVGLFAGALQTDQDTGRWRHSRRAFVGLDYRAPAGARGDLAISAGVLGLNGGNDSRGRDSLSAAPFVIADWNWRLSPRERFGVRLAAAVGKSGYAAGPGPFTRITEAGISYSFRPEGRNWAWFVTADTTLIAVRGRTALAARALTFGITTEIGSRPARLPTLTRWTALTGGPLY